MNITRVRIFPFDTSVSGKQIRAFAEIELEQEIIIRGFKIIERKNGGIFISNPSVKSSDGEFKDIVFFNNPDFSRKVREAILESFHRTEEADRK
jgi:DNA-binding cell septation regulator SpoVG